MVEGVTYTTGQPTAAGSAQREGPMMVKIVTGSEKERKIDENLRLVAWCVDIDL